MGGWLPNALFGIITLLTLFFIGKRKYGSQFGVLWAMIFAGSILPLLYFKSGIIDPVFHALHIYEPLLPCRSISGYVFTGSTTTPPRPPTLTKHYAFAGIAAGLAVLTKLPRWVTPYIIDGKLLPLAAMAKPNLPPTAFHPPVSFHRLHGSSRFAMVWRGSGQTRNFVNQRIYHLPSPLVRHF